MPTSAPPVVAMVGGGQLARMTHQAAVSLGQSLRVLAVSADESAAQVARDVVIGAHDDLAALRRVAAGASVLTFDHEQVPAALLAELSADGVNLAPPPQALRYAQDKLAMRAKLRDLGFPIPRFAPVASVADLDAFAAQVGGPVVVKAARGGYDGRGVDLPADLAGARGAVRAYLDAGVEVLVEERVAMHRELAALVARSPYGQGAAWPVVETVQRNGICVEVIAPAPGLCDTVGADAESLALSLAERLGVVGVMAVELFETDDGQLLVNELAMRPHNSGHWTLDGSRTSQFEQHLRAVLDYPLGDTASTSPYTVMANVIGAADPPTMSLDQRLHHLYGRMPHARVHLYGKPERPGRKVGHVNVGGPDPTLLRREAALAAGWLARARWDDGWQAS